MWRGSIGFGLARSGGGGSGGRRTLKCSFKNLNTRVAFSGDVSVVFVHPVVHFCRWKLEWTGVREKKNGKMTTRGGGSVVPQRRGRRGEGGEEREPPPPEKPERYNPSLHIRLRLPGRDPFSLRPVATAAAVAAKPRPRPARVLNRFAAAEKKVDDQ